jgi:hypothetical protein
MSTTFASSLSDPRESQGNYLPLCNAILPVLRLLSGHGMLVCGQSRCCAGFHLPIFLTPSLRHSTRRRTATFAPGNGITNFVAD